MPDPYPRGGAGASGRVPSCRRFSRYGRMNLAMSCFDSVVCRYLQLCRHLGSSKILVRFAGCLDPRLVSGASSSAAAAADELAGAGSSAPRTALTNGGSISMSSTYSRERTRRARHDEGCTLRPLNRVGVILPWVPFPLVPMSLAYLIDNAGHANAFGGTPSTRARDAELALRSWRIF